MDPQGELKIGGYYTGTATFGSTILTSAGQDDIFGARIGPTGGVSWAVSAGGAAEDRANGIAMDTAGNLYLTGHFGRFSTAATFPTATPTTLTPSGSYDAYVLRLNHTTGVGAWVSPVGGTHYDWGYFMTADATDNYAVGWTTGPQTLCGHTFTGSNTEAYVVRHDNNGTCLWLRTFGTPTDNEEVGGVGVGGGRVYVNVMFKSTGVFGTTNLTSLGDWDGALVSLTDAGVFQWAKGLHSPNAVTMGPVLVDGNFVYTSGAFSGTMTIENTTLTAIGGTDAFLAKFDNNGNLIWAKRFGSTGNDAIRGISKDNNGRVYLVGDFTGTWSLDEVSLVSQGGRDIYFAVLESDGRLVWAERAGGPNDDIGYGIHSTTWGTRFHVVGTFIQQATFASKTRTATNNGMFVWLVMP